MFLVSGGWKGGLGHLDSTEIYDPDHGSWIAGAALPSKRTTLSAANIDGRLLFFGINILLRFQKVHIILTGGGDGTKSFDTILEYDVTADSFTQIGTMTQARSWHAISVVRYEDFSKSCP